MSIVDTITSKSIFKFGGQQKPLSLSDYFPAGTCYFYGYPAGEDSGFLNKVSPRVEELVAARTLSCAGPDVSVVKFAATDSTVIGEDIIKSLAIPQLPREQVILLPKEIDAKLEGELRNIAIKIALEKQVKSGSLVMAQPYTDKHIEHLFQIPTQLSTWVNDKNNMNQYIDARYLPKRLGVYMNGHQFNEHHNEITLPCVVKASASSSGDGVFICFNQQDMQKAVESLSKIEGTIYVESHVEAKKNFGIHFGIPYDRSKPINLIGVNQQLTSDAGEFIGGTIESAAKIPSELLPLERYLLDDVLPKIRGSGWYGVGCFDVLSDANDNLYIIDCNFRVTGMSAYHFLVLNKVIKTPLMSFGGEFTGSRQQLEEKLYPYASNSGSSRMLQIIALTRYGDLWNFNAALSYDSEQQLKNRAEALLQIGVRSRALEMVTSK